MKILGINFNHPETSVVLFIDNEIVFGIEEERIHPAPFLRALLINLLPSFFFPLTARNKLSLLKFLVSIDTPLNFT